MVSGGQEHGRQVEKVGKHKVLVPGCHSLGAGRGTEIRLPPQAPQGHQAAPQGVSLTWARGWLCQRLGGCAALRGNSPGSVHTFSHTGSPAAPGLPASPVGGYCPRAPPRGGLSQGEGGPALRTNPFVVKRKGFRGGRWWVPGSGKSCVSSGMTWM